eukprot:TRINITY_DN27438_c0_g2_i1.p1 TRINITY_DN27438_c0_g2~~TRINITY_DN27438_c0_g2_i1.p1  ORF type:complete len:216 (-),score=57.30 TRINITY_DN27438_c0_g2_i1:294-941(-)
MIRRPPRSTLSSSSAASDVYKRQGINAEYGEISNRSMQTEQDGGGTSEQELADIEVDELLMRHTSLDVEIEKFLEVETWNDKYGIPDDLAPPLDQSLATPSQQHGARNPAEIDRALQQRESRFSAMHQRITRMCGELDSSAAQNTEAIRRVLTEQTKIEQQAEMETAEFSSAFESQVKQRDDHTSNLQKENELLRACLKSGSFSDFASTANHPTN